MKYWALLLFCCLYFNALGQKMPAEASSFISPCARQSTNFIVKISGQTDSFTRVATQYGLKVIAHYAPAGIVIVKGPIQTVRRLPGVVYVDCYEDKIETEAAVPGHNLFVNRFNTRASAFPTIKGGGIAVSIREERFDTTDVDLLGRVGASPDASMFLSTHASQMATLVGGSGTSSPRARGGAPECLLYTSAYTAFLPNDPAQYVRQGISVQNHSYGAAEKINRYDLSALAYDHSTHLRPVLLHVFSAGNKGTEVAAPGPYSRLTGFANLTGGFKTGKNGLVIGATDSLGRVWPFSSKGPTQDGRIKPDLVAFGQGGTSDAAALTSAAAALVQQALRQHLDSLPPAALVRAVLLGGADDTGAPGPDFESGFGRLNVRRALDIVQKKQYRQGRITANARQNTVLEIPNGTGTLAVTLAWDDLPAAAGAAKVLINDLDLWLVDPNGRIYRPWIKPHAPDSVQVPARPGRDTINTVEQVTVNRPVAGRWTIWIGSTTLATISQPYALTFTQTPLATFQWTCPAQGDVLTAGKDALLYWESTLPPTEKGQLEWQVIGQSHWRTLSTSFSSDAAAFRWALPDTFALACLRLRIGTQIFLSDTFLIARDMRLRVGFNCTDSVLLSWPPVISPRTFYAVYGLGARYLEPLFVTQDTFVVLDRLLFPQQRFSVRALVSGSSLSGALAPAPDVAQQGAGCYINSFNAVVASDRTAQLRLNLGSIYGVDSVRIERQEQDVWITLDSGAPALTFEATDIQPLQGANLYRAKVFLTGRRSLVSGVVTLYFPGFSARQALLYPVPTSGDQLFWIPDDASAESSATFIAFDMLGRKVAEAPLEADAIPFFFRVPSLPAGVYYYTIVRPDKPVLSGIWMMGQ